MTGACGIRCFNTRTLHRAREPCTFCLKSCLAQRTHMCHFIVFTAATVGLYSLQDVRKRYMTISWCMQRCRGVCKGEGQHSCCMTLKQVHAAPRSAHTLQTAGPRRSVRCERAGVSGSGAALQCAELMPDFSAPARAVKASPQNR